jgi:hypothetical protein
VWAVSLPGEGHAGRLAADAISFLPVLSAGLEASHVVYMKATGNSAEQKAHCPGSASAPTASSGYLCVYTGTSASETKEVKFKAIQTAEGAEGASPQGAIVLFEVESNTSVLEVLGTWAVKAA